MAVWTVYLSLGLLLALNASVETRPVQTNKECGVCETGWTAYGCRCFKFFKPKYSWDGAEFGCLNVKGNLASVHSHDEYMFLQKLVRQTTHASTPIWIGGHKGFYRWFWSDGSPMNYRIWSAGQPSNGVDELCVEMNSDHGNWNDVDCRVTKSYVCAK